MSSRYAVVGRTYLRWPFWVLAAPLVAYWVSVWAWPSPNPSTVAPLVVIASWWAGAMALHLKEQMADWRSSLLPGFRPPHLLVSVLILAVIVAAMPALMAWKLHLSIIAILGFSMLCGALLGGIAYFQNIWAILITFSVPVVFMQPGAVQWMTAIAAGDAPVRAALVFACGFAALAALFWRQGILHEEMFDYRRAPTGLRLDPMATWDPAALRVARLEASPIHGLLHRAHRLSRIRNIYNAGIGERVRHYRMISPAFSTAWLMAGCFAALGLVIPLLSRRHPQNVSTGMAIVGLMMMYLPMPAVAFEWVRHWPMLGYEISRPTTRQEYFLEMGIAMLLDLGTAFLAALIGGWIALLIWSPLTLYDLLRSSFYPVTAAATLLMFAINVWILRFRNVWLFTFSVIGTLILSGLPHKWVGATIGLTGNQVGLIMPGSATASWVVFALFAAAAVVLWDAYRRWCEADLD